MAYKDVHLWVLRTIETDALIAVVSDFSSDIAESIEVTAAKKGLQTVWRPETWRRISSSNEEEE